MGCMWCSNPPSLILHLQGSGEDSDEAIGASLQHFWRFGVFKGVLCRGLRAFGGVDARGGPWLGLFWGVCTAQPCSACG